MVCLDCLDNDIRYVDAEKSYHCNNCGSRNLENNFVRAFRISKGCKIYFEGQKACLKMEGKLNELGIETRVGCNEAGMWSIYIVSVPERSIDSIIEF